MMKKSLYDLKKQFSKKKLEGLVFRPFDGTNLNRAINLIIYGVYVKKLKRSKTSTEKLLIYLKEGNLDTLQCLTFKKKSIRKFKIILARISNISEDPELKNASLMKKENTLSVIYNSNNTNLIIEFESSEIKYLFWEGLQHFYQIPKTNNFEKFLL